MRKVLLAALVMAIFGLCAAPAFAGTITLAPSGTNGGKNAVPTATLHFTSTGGGNFGLAIATGTNGIAVDNFNSTVTTGYYSVVQTSGTITGAYNMTTGVFDITQSPSTNINFYYGASAPGGSDAAYLAGNLQLVSLQQTASAHSGIFNEALVVNLTNIPAVCASSGGACSLASEFANNGIVTLTLHFTSTTNLMTASSGAKLAAYISSGAVTPVLPEPGSLALLGSGLIALGGVVRRGLTSKAN